MKAAVQAVTTAMKGPQAIAITAITTAVTLVALNWDKVKTAVIGVNEKLEEQKRLSQETIPILEEAKNIIEGQKSEGERLEETLNNLEDSYTKLGKAIYGLENNQDSNEIFKGWKKNLKEQGVEVKT
jgi:L-lactate utilization protein LutB